MTLVPSCQLNPVYFKESLHSSLLKFQAAPQLQFFRYNSPFPSFNKRSLCPTQKRICSQFIDRQNPRKGSNFVPRNNGEVPRSQSDSGASSSDNKWLDKWNRPRRQQISPKPPQMAVNYRNNGGGVVSNWGSRRAGSSDSGTDYGGGGASTMDKIVEKLKRFGYMDDENEREEKSERRIEKGSVEDIFYVEEGILPNTRGGFSEDSPLGVVERPFGGDGEARFPWEKPAAIEEEAKYSVRKRSRTSMAELTLPEPELRRLRNLSVKTKQKVKIGGGGVTKAVVDTIRDKWKDSEIVRLKVEGASALNMRRMHEILERKTGGLVIWRSGTSLSMYRGISYNHPSEHFRKQAFKDTSLQNVQSTPTDISIQDQSKLDSDNTIHPVEETFKGDTSENFDSESSMEVRYEDEIDKLLADLGPRYEDWPGGDPLPVDADMLPSSVPGYKPPFRLLPYGVRATISVKEATALRRIARTLPPHFALGRNRQLQGLATAMVKLWERSSIAKVALKRGVQVTTSERMAEDIKRLTGGMLLSRNKDFLVFYRGKNFLSPAVAETLLERERMAMNLQDEEEQARLRSSAMVTHIVETAQKPIAAGSLEETLNADARWGKKLDDTDKENALREAEMLRHADLVKKLERKLTLAEKKLMKGQYALEKVEHFLNPSKREADPESISDEERFMYRKLGLRMKAFLLLGRRGVFDGTIENMHLHWKYRELVKIIVKVKTFEEVKRIALSLEAESGGVLVSVDKVSKGYAIVVFRGKDYQRPSMLRPKNLLTKRKALARSIELQRREALLKHIATMQRNVAKLRSEIDQVETMEGQVDAEFYNTLESAYPSEEEDSEEEEDNAYLTTYNSENEEGEEEGETSSNFIQTLKSERNGGGRYKDETLETESEEEDEQSCTGDYSEDEDDSSSVHFPWDDQDPEAAETRPSL